MRTTQIFAITLALLGSSAAIAQEATPDTWQKSASVRSRADVQREAIAARAAGEFDVAREYDVVDRNFASTRSRAEVLAELEIWRESGLADLSRGEAPDVHSPHYRQAVARYAELRTSPTFVARVQAIARQRGESDAVAMPRKAPLM